MHQSAARAGVSSEAPTLRLQKVIALMEAGIFSACFSIIPGSVSERVWERIWKLLSPLSICQASTIQVARKINQDLINERSKGREQGKEGKRKKGGGWRLRRIRGPGPGREC